MMTLIYWTFGLLIALWLLMGIILAAPLFLAAVGIYFLAAALIKKIGSFLFWRVSHARKL